MGRKKVLALNKAAKFNYEIDKTFDAGLSLFGSEVKSLQKGGGDISSSFVKIENREAFVYGFTIRKYEKSSSFASLNHDPNRPKKLLLNKSEILKLDSGAKRSGYTIIPTEVYRSSTGFIKIEIGLAKGRNVHDKREYIKERDLARDFKKENNY